MDGSPWYLAPPVERFAVISDIHGNLPALESVLADAKRRGAAAQAARLKGLFDA